MTVVAKAEFAQSYMTHPHTTFLFISKKIGPLFQMINTK